MQRHDSADRRTHRRREEDDEHAVIIEHAVHDAPIVHRLLKTGKVSAAMMATGALIGVIAANLGYRISGPADDVARSASIMQARIDTNAYRISSIRVRTDSLVNILNDMRHTVETVAYIQCVQLRRSDSDLRPQGCDEALAKVNSR